MGETSRYAMRDDAMKAMTTKSMRLKDERQTVFGARQEERSEREKWKGNGRVDDDRLALRFERTVRVAVVDF